jgi:hypothetical protein
MVHQMVPGSHELLGGDHPGLGELGLLQQGREVLGHLQALGLDVVEDVLHRHVPSKYVLGELLSFFLSFLLFLFFAKVSLSAAEDKRAKEALSQNLINIFNNL